jgi:hypothetical protein
MGLAPIPLEASAAPQVRRREGLKPNGRDGKDGTGRSPQSPTAHRADPPRGHHKIYPSFAQKI